MEIQQQAAAARRCRAERAVNGAGASVHSQARQAGRSRGGASSRSGGERRGGRVSHIGCCQATERVLGCYVCCRCFACHACCACCAPPARTYPSCPPPGGSQVPQELLLNGHLQEVKDALHLRLGAHVLSNLRPVVAVQLQACTAQRDREGGGWVGGGRATPAGSEGRLTLQGGLGLRAGIHAGRSRQLRA